MAEYTISNSNRDKYIKYDITFTKEQAEKFNSMVLDGEGLLEHIGNPNRRKVNLEEFIGLHIPT